MPASNQAGLLAQHDQSNLVCVDDPGSDPNWDPRDDLAENPNDKSSSVGALCWAVYESIRVDSLVEFEHSVVNGGNALWAPGGGRRSQAEIDAILASGAPVAFLDDESQGDGTNDRQSDSGAVNSVPEGSEGSPRPVANTDSVTEDTLAPLVQASKEAHIMIAGSEYQSLIDDSELSAESQNFAKAFFERVNARIAGDNFEPGAGINVEDLPGIWEFEQEALNSPHCAE